MPCAVKNIPLMFVINLSGRLVCYEVCLANLDFYFNLADRLCGSEKFVAHSDITCWNGTDTHE